MNITSSDSLEDYTPVRHCKIHVIHINIVNDLMSDYEQFIDSNISADKVNNIKGLPIALPIT